MLLLGDAHDAGFDLVDSRFGLKIGQIGWDDGDGTAEPGWTVHIDEYEAVCDDLDEVFTALSPYGGLEASARDELAALDADERAAAEERRCLDN
jgi:hypothetical protein